MARTTKPRSRPADGLLALQAQVALLRDEMRASRKATNSLSKGLAAFAESSQFLKDLVRDYAQVHAADAQRVAFMRQQLDQSEGRARALVGENERIKAELAAALAAARRKRKRRR